MQPQFKLELKREDKEKPVKLIRKQSSAIRSAYIQSAWQVPKVALLFLLLGNVLPRDFSLLKPVLVERIRNWVKGRVLSKI